MRQVAGSSSRRRGGTRRLARRVVVGRAVVVVAALAVAFALPAPSAADSVSGYGAPSVVGQVPTNGGYVSQIAVADFNGDGLDDALLTRAVPRGLQTFPVTVLLNDGQGRFVDATSAIFVGEVPATQGAREPVVADFNGDRRPDVFIPDTGASRDPFPGYQNTLILSAPGGKLVDATANLPQASDFTFSAAAGDVNGDGRTDLYVGNIYGSSRVPPRILLGDGSGHFSIGAGLLPAAQADLDSNKYTSSLFADVNGDEKRDLILGGEDLPTQSVVLLGDGTGHFALLRHALPAKPFGPRAIAVDMASEDVNADRHPDLLIAFTKHSPFWAGHWIQVLINKGDGTFRDETASRLPQTDNDSASPASIRQRDLNGDHRTDFGLVSGNFAPLFLLDSQGVFEPGPPVFGTLVWSFIDAEGDGSNDILTAANSVGTDSAAVSLLRERLVTVPRLTHLQLSPTVFRAARAGASIAATDIGTELSYGANEPATTTFKVEHTMPGVRSGRGCVDVRPPRKAPRGKGCTRFVMVRGTFGHRDSAGPNQMEFTGRVGSKALKPGSYRLSATPSDDRGNIGRTVTAPFRIVR